MDYGFSAEPAVDVLELSTTLARLGLGQYGESLRENGFEDWESVTNITETDMVELGFKLGDRRKLQRAIRKYVDSSAPPAEHEAKNIPLPSEGPPSVEGYSKTSPSSKVARVTRPYRWRPRPDPNAPQKPKTAYVVFGEHVRQDPALGPSSFTDLAKVTGKRWRELSDEERGSVWEIPATKKLQEYKEEFMQYKQSENHQMYQTYLEKFKQRLNNQEPTTSSVTKAASTSQAVTSGSKHALQAQDRPEVTREDSSDTKYMGREGESQDTIPPVNSGMAEVRQVAKALGISLHHMRVNAYPSEESTTKAVESFLQGTGSLLYLWKRDEALSLVKSVYRSQPGSIPAHATEVFAMSAVGSYCDGEPHTSLSQETFLHFFLYMLSSPPEISNLSRMRLFACLAICRFTNSVESARSLMLSALDIGRQTFTSSSFIAETPEEKIRYWWYIFRSIVFLESWFAYNTSHESRVTNQDLNLYHPPTSHAEQDLDVFQERVGELGQLAAYIALDLKTATQPSAAQAQLHFESLNGWHRTLPPPMQLSRLSLANPLSLNWQSKRSLLQLHILFLGLCIEPYRSGLIDLGRLRLGISPLEPETLHTLKSVEKQCVMAARQSARVASLLQTDNLIRSRCWVSVYTCFTGCTVLLFSASQKLVEFLAEEVGQELSYASSHLNVLSLCSYDNEIARKLYIPLQIIFNDIREIAVSPVYRSMRASQTFVKDVVLVPGSSSDADEGVAEVGRNIVDLTERIMSLLQESLSF
ncbi:hypothetical protein P153DRAFT_324148 [Dothidotthia symphoricarpi CBS 119687]|uniref:HMG box domain-containing protein n=1 Tax=Dothidotthia symphoricarpi CBS 119687 TaxID=1392245 RepID=A0A6A6A5G7_9PLEO|nr:uncharacterized protein P153DRAFT_324148 [Dothidotthia symphoricarpi CBS 119687]KAF2125851.1 hypothetical protein P153DRAFT_324148 [Dothidotthia symphoricarpi CBS 119687]